MGGCRAVRVRGRRSRRPTRSPSAETVTATLPRYASEPHKESRAPQNLYPVGGLERELRRRLGDPDLLYRALRRSAHTAATV